ncbi:pirin family protein [bacterium]|nr:MAG: pirin family protein [bacterium]
MKKPIEIRKAPRGHWVGDGFPVRSMFSYDRDGAAISPFLLLDYAGPAEFPPTERRLGVGEHPHRGFETVTVVYQGEVEHRDSAGHGGKIGPGDVQWMTAASGIVHEERHGREFARRGGTLEMVQLWVNLPAKFKMTEPRYQDILDAQIPQVELPDGAGLARIIAGELFGTRGPAKTFSPVDLWDLRLKAGRRAELPLSEGHGAQLLLLRGRAAVAGGETLEAAEIALFERAGNGIALEAKEDATALLMSGAPIEEPIAGYGPFVMNTREEIQQAMQDYESGRMGRLG